MRGSDWLVDWAKVAKLALFAVAMYGVYHLVRFLLLDVGWWTFVPWAAFWFFIAYLVDSRDQALARQRELEDRQNEPEPW